MQYLRTLKQTEFMNNWKSALIGIFAGMSRYLHLLKAPGVNVITLKIDPIVTAILCSFAGVIGKDMAKWVKVGFRLYCWPPLKSKALKFKIKYMNTQNPLFAFLLEMFSRWRTKSPKFFQIWQYISGFAAAVTGIPEALTSFGISLPSPFLVIESKVVSVASICVFIMSKMTTQSSAVLITSDGVVLKKTDQRKLPFTASVEAKEVIKSDTISLNSSYMQVINK